MPRLRLLVLTLCVACLAPALPASSAPMGAMAAADTQFAVDLYKAVAAAGSRPNLLLSPCNLAQGLYLLRAGAKGATQKQINDLLHNGLTDREAAFQVAVLKRSLALRSPGVEWAQSAVLWGGKGIPFSPAFGRTAAAYGPDSFKVLDFAGKLSESLLAMNDWTQERSKGAVVDLFRQGDVQASSVLVLSEAASLSGNWAFAIRAQDSGSEPFTLAAGNTVDAQAMHLTRDCFYLDAGRAQVLQLPYAGRGLSLQVILPKGDLDLLESNLSAGDLSAWTQGLKIRSVRVSLPKFSVSTRMALNEALMSLGMKDAFGPAADFSGMAAGSALALATVMHQANLVVDEGGQSSPKAALPQSKDDKSAVDFKANHPFLFLVRHAASGEIVLMGRINDPNQP